MNQEELRKNNSKDHPKSQPILFDENFFSIQGRIRRRTYFLRLLLLSVFSSIASILLDINEYGEPILLFILYIVVIGASVVTIIQGIKRLHDLNLSGWYLLISLIPFVGIVFAIYVIFADGTHGENKYGSDPKGRDWLNF